MKNISRILPLIFLFCILSESTKSQSYRVSIDHFSDEDGLTHSSILKILQDRKGFIWLATYDGMVKFDGYKFKSIKVQPQDSITLKSNRVNSMHEDTYGRIWLKSNKDEAYCFDPNSNRFWALQNTSAYNNESFLLSRIKTTLSGRVWLLSQDSECICIMDSLYTLHSFRNKMGNKKVHGILEDRDKNTWILTDNGIGFISDDEFPSIRFHFEQGNSSGNVTSHSFFSSLELGDKILFGCASGKVWCYLKKSRAFYDLDINLNVNIVNILELNKDEIIIITRNKGFFTYNLLTNQLKTYNSHTVKGLQTEDMHALFVNSSNQLWFENNNTGIYKYDFQTESLSSFSTSSSTKAFKWKFPPKTLLVRDCNKTLWLQPQGGIFSLYDPENDRLIPFKEIIKDSLSKISNIFEVAYFDRQNNLWFCSKTQGLAKASFTKNKFEQIRIMAPNTLFSSNNTRSIFEDSQKNIWIATKEESRLVLYNKNKEKIGFLSPNGEISDNTEWESAIYCIMQDRDMNIWLGTKGNGIYIFSPTNTHYKYNVQHFQHNPTDKFSLSSNGIYSIIQDHNGRIWIGTWKGGLNLAQKKNGRLSFIHSQNMLKNYPAGTYSNIRCMAEDKNGNIHIGSTNGLLSFSSDFKEISSIGYHGFKNFANHDILDILITRKNALYLSTFGGGLYKETEKNLEGFPLKFKKHHATTSNLTGGLLSIQEDKEDNIWIFSETNLIRFKPSDESFEVFPDVKNILGNSSFSESGSRVLSSGEILAGYSNGIIAFHPEQIQSNDFVPYLAFTDFQLSNLPSEDSQYLFFKEAIDEFHKIVLAHNQNFFKIQFVALDFSEGNNIQYRYKLEGLEDRWNYSSHLRMAGYTNIPKGEYLFRVSSTNNNGIWTNNERQLRIIVKPSIWNTTTAYIIYIILTISLIILIQKTVLTIFHLKSDLKMQRKMAALKLNFFTDISHELRTPLTMITAPVENLINDSNTSNHVKEQLSIVSKNTKKLLSLVNKILDLRKIESEPLNIEEIDLVKFSRDICSNFVVLAKKKNIELQSKSSTDFALIWADKESLDKMLGNLISNAIKFSPSGSMVNISVDKQGKNTSVRISDNGPGISKEKQKKLFVRFTNFNDDPNRPSTGIGLSIVKELADKHSAQIRIESEIGRGSTFILSFQNGNKHIIQGINKKQSNSTPGEYSDEKKIDVLQENLMPPLSKTKKPLGLIVEDDIDLRSFMKSIVENDYTIFEAENGQQGYEKAKSLNPDFIVTDIMMPVQDGIEMLTKIKNDISTSHIPVMLLTAKTDIKSKITGLNHGADSYITKPFSVSYFKARIDNLIQQRKRLHKFYTNFSPSSAADQNEISSSISKLDQEFMNQVIGCIEKNIEDSSFNVETLVKAIGMSRSTFFNKLKGLTGMAPVEFIRDFRLKTAAELIASEGLLIKEACYLSGFTDVKYFGRCFKSKYEVTPSEFRQVCKNTPQQ